MNTQMIATIASAFNSNSKNNDKNEIYADFDLVKQQKRDSKSHSATALKQVENRQKKLSEKISQLPKKMQQKLLTEATAVVPGKPKEKTTTKTFYTRQKISQNALVNEYDEQLLGEEDALVEDAEFRYREEFDDDEETYRLIYEDCKYELEYCRSEWDATKLQWFQKEVDDYENAHGINHNTRVYNEYTFVQVEEPELSEEEKYKENCRRLKDDENLSSFDFLRIHQEISAYEELEIWAEAEEKEYQEGLALWKRYNLDKSAYDEHLEYEQNCLKLKVYYQDEEYASHPEYGEELEARVKAYREAFDARLKERDLKDEENDWWVDSEIADDFEDIIKEQENEYEDYLGPEIESYSEWLERKREQDMENFRQEMIEQNRDY